MKRFCSLLALLMLIASLSSCAAKPSDSTAGPANSAAVSASPAAAPETSPSGQPADETPDFQPLAMEDFTVETIDGSSFTLSEALKNHELVVLNLFATWCNPCRAEFPYMQKVWSEYSDKVSVIAVSTEPNDTVQKLTKYASDLGLGFPVAREGSSGLSRFVTHGIPTTVLIDRYCNVVAVEIGAKTSADEFRKLFDRYIGDDYDPSQCAYTVYVYDNRNREVPGVVINFCTDTMCTPVVSDENGIATFIGAPAKYHVEVISVPEGFTLPSASTFYTQPYAQQIYVELKINK